MHLSRRAAAVIGPAAFALALAPTAIGSANAAGVAGSGHTKVAGNCGKATYKPKKIILTCADANADLSHIDYTSWTAAQATGRARYDFNDCTPDCAAGHFKHESVTFVLKRVHQEHGVKVFTDAVVDHNGHKQSFSPGI